MKTANRAEIWRHAQKILRRRLQVARWLGLSDQHTLLLWAAAAGVLAGLVAAGFLGALRGVQWVFTQRSDDIVMVARQMPPWQRVLTPMAGGLFAGLCLLLIRRFATGKRSTDYLEAISLGDGRLPFRLSLVKAAAALFSVGSGGSIGREGALVQLAALSASRMGVWAGLHATHLRVLVAAGTAGGVAAAYHAPIAGSLFVAEVVLGSLAMESFGPLIVAAVAATLTARQLGEATPLYQTQALGLVSWWESVPMAVLGILAGFGARLCVTWFRRCETWFARLPVILPGRMAAGGLVVGLISVRWPEVWGNGQSVIGAMLKGDWIGFALLGLLLAKLAATGATTGSGAVGGVLTPTLFLGAALGAITGQVVHGWFPAGSADPAAYALVGMAALLAAMTHAPLVSIVLVFELTSDYDMVVPAMLGAVCAHVTASGLSVESVYAESLRRKQVGQTAIRPQDLCVRNVLKESPPTVAANATLGEVANSFLLTRRMNLAVVSPTGELLGLINLHDIKEYLTEVPIGRLVTAEELMQPTPLLTPEMSLHATLEAFTGFQGERLPVVDDASSRRLVGSVAKFDLLLALVGGPQK
jgi:CIC family chloride channel protein